MSNNRDGQQGDTKKRKASFITQSNPDDTVVRTFQRVLLNRDRQRNPGGNMAEEPAPIWHAPRYVQAAADQLADLAMGGMEVEDPEQHGGHVTDPSDVGTEAQILEEKPEGEDNQDTQMQIIAANPKYTGFEQYPNCETIQWRKNFTTNANNQPGGVLNIVNTGGQNATQANHDYEVTSCDVNIYRGTCDPPEEHERVWVRFSRQNFMMEFKDFKKRLVGTDAELRAIYEQDWKDSEDSTKNYKPFLIYNPEGDFEGRRAQMPSHGLIVGPGSYGAHQTRESRQHQQWRYIATEIACKEPTRPFNVIGRYWDMKTDQTVVDTSLQLRFEASDRVTKAELAAMVKAAVNKCRVSPTIEVVDKGCGGLDGYVWIGSHLLGLYRTYASRDGLQRLRALKQHGPPRPFPTPMQAWQASQLMGMQLPAPGTVPDKKKPKETKTDISEIKIIDYTGKARGKTQGQVMKASATDLAKLFDWPENSQEAGGGWANQAEWLHRSAFSFGGLSNEPITDNSPQRRENLIFGTKQSNTYMIRPETSVKHLAKLRHASLWDIKENFHPRPNGQQLTATQRQTLGPAEMLWSAKVAVSVSTDFEYGSREDHGGEARALQPLDERLEERVEYAKGTAEAALDTRVPDNQRQHFLKKNDFSFLTHRLIYDVRLEFDENKRHVNERIIIDPFSTFIPLRLEAELDTLVENYVFGDGVLPTEPLKRGVVTESHAVAPQDPVKAQVPRRRAKSLLSGYSSHAEDVERYTAPVLNNNVIP